MDDRRVARVHDPGRRRRTEPAANLALHAAFDLPDLVAFVTAFNAGCG